MRRQTSGKAMWNTHFKAWGELPKSKLSQMISDIRKRKDWLLILHQWMTLSIKHNEFGFKKICSQLPIGLY